MHSWNSKSKQSPRAIVVVYHGFFAHSNYPTVRYAAELLSANGYNVLAADLPGHGTSPGTRGYLASADTLIQDGVTIAEFARKTTTDAAIPLFLLGSSMGGTIALVCGKATRRCKFPEWYYLLPCWQ